MKVFDSETVQRKWDSLRVVPMTDAQKRIARATAPLESLTVSELEKQLNKENTLSLVDPIVGRSAWEAREKHRAVLHEINQRNKDFYGGKSAA